MIKVREKRKEKKAQKLKLCLRKSNRFMHDANVLPAVRLGRHIGRLAQSAERRANNANVMGSSPISAMIIFVLLVFPAELECGPSTLTWSFPPVVFGVLRACVLPTVSGW